jgi:hypothetical protein
VITKEIGLTINGTGNDESEIYPVTKMHRYMREKKCVSVAKESLLPSNRNGVTLIQAEAVVMCDDIIKEVSKRRKIGAIKSINALNDHMQQVVNGSIGSINDKYR